MSKWGSFLVAASLVGGAALLGTYGADETDPAVTEALQTCKMDLTRDHIAKAKALLAEVEQRGPLMTAVEAGLPRVLAQAFDERKGADCLEAFFLVSKLLADRQLSSGTSDAPLPVREWRLDESQLQRGVMVLSET